MNNIIAEIYVDFFFFFTSLCIIKNNTSLEQNLFSKWVGKVLPWDQILPNPSLCALCLSSITYSNICATAHPQWATTCPKQPLQMVLNNPCSSMTRDHPALLQQLPSLRFYCPHGAPGGPTCGTHRHHPKLSQVRVCAQDTGTFHYLVNPPEILHEVTVKEHCALNTCLSMFILILQSS